MAFKVTITVQAAWWYVWIYIPLLRLGCLLGLEPIEERLAAATRAALKTEVKIID